MIRFLVALGIFASALAIGCGGGSKSDEEGSAIPDDLGAAWATAVKISVDVVRTHHLDKDSYQSQLNDAGAFMIDLCAVALVDLRAAEIDDGNIQRGCETAERAASTPAGSAAPVYEGAYEAFTAAGALLGWGEVSAASRSRIQLLLLLGNDPTMLELDDAAATHEAADKIHRICWYFDAETQACSSLVSYLNRSDPSKWAPGTLSSKEFPTRLSSLWTELLAEVRPEPTPGAD